MSKEERYTYHCDQYDYVEIIYDNEECEEIDSMKMAEKRLNRQQDKISDLEAKLAEKEEEKDYYQDLYFNAVKKQERTNKVVEQFQQRVKYFSEKEQDKISFCIENLENIKWFTENLACELGDTDLVNRFKVVKEIDNQIKQLKEKQNESKI